MLFLWWAFISMFSLVQIWTEKGKPNAVLCTDFYEYPEVFVRFFFSCLLRAHAFCHSTFLVCSLPHYSSLPYWWTQLVLNIPELGQNFVAVVDEETHCWRTSATKCTLYVQRPFKIGHHTADLDIFFVVVFLCPLGEKNKIKSSTLWAVVPQSLILNITCKLHKCMDVSLIQSLEKIFCCCRPSEIEAVNRGWRVLDCNKASDVF